jgi:hypothetical protein
MISSSSHITLEERVLQQHYNITLETLDGWKILVEMMATLRQSVLDRVAGYKSQQHGGGGVSIISQRFYVVVVVVIEQICLFFIWLCQTKYKRRCM